MTEQIANGSQIRAALAQTSPDQVLATAPPARLVVPGEDVMEWSAPLVAGEYIDLSAGRFLALALGYLAVDENRISVVPPLWLSPDRMEACFALLPLADPPQPLQPGWLLELLWGTGVRHGIQGKAIEALCAGPLPCGEKRLVRLAKGDLPVEGAVGQVQCYVAPQLQATVLEDGTIDFASLIGGSQLVQVDEVLAELTPTAGQPGMDVTAAPLAALPGDASQELGLRAGRNVRQLVRQGRPALLLSEVAGVAHLVDNTVSVMAVCELQDVDGQTGPVEEERDVRVTGSVLSGASIKTSGSILIDGHVDAGALLEAQGDILVAKGISGENTRVVCRGNLETKFLQNCSVTVNHNLVVGSFIFQSRVSAGGRVLVMEKGGSRGGSIIGGEILASKGIEAALVGSKTATPTTVGIAPNPVLAAQLAKLEELAKSLDANILRIMRTLNIDKVDVQQIKLMAERSPPSRRAYLMSYIRKLIEMVQYRDKTERTLEDLKLQGGVSCKDAVIRVTKTIFPEVRVRIEEAVFNVSQLIEQPVFFKSPEGILYRVGDDEQTHPVKP
ncbi:MAG: DUF342 domain-containing protein [Candidatus Handelsmanbacteria bacterium]|nr:DUF342 domain-containing protein [Candidatus Handelsmanbacteria bacterium]